MSKPARGRGTNWITIVIIILGLFLGCCLVGGTCAVGGYVFYKYKPKLSMLKLDSEKETETGSRDSTSNSQENDSNSGILEPPIFEVWIKPVDTISCDESSLEEDMNIVKDRIDIYNRLRAKTRVYIPKSYRIELKDKGIYLAYHVDEDIADDELKLVAGLNKLIAIGEVSISYYDEYSQVFVPIITNYDISSAELIYDNRGRARKLRVKLKPGTDLRDLISDILGEPMYISVDDQHIIEFSVDDVLSGRTLEIDLKSTNLKVTGYTYEDIVVYMNAGPLTCHLTLEDFKLKRR